MEKTDIYNRAWIIATGVPIVESYHGNLTLRALHYRLVAAGMFNTMRHYKRVIAAMTQARWEGLVEFDDFQDHDRDVLGETDYAETDPSSAADNAEDSVKFWLKHYRKNRWENQPIYAEVFIEKKALQGVFDEPCTSYNIALCPCKGYPSLTYMNAAADRFKEAEELGKELIILYFGDYDPSGEDIPRSVGETLSKMGVKVKVKRIALMKHQVIELGLPPAPAKTTDSRTANWDGLGQVELDAIEPADLIVMLNGAIDDIFDDELHNELLKQEREERTVFREDMRKRVNNIFNEE